MTIDYDKDQLAYALANALKERDEAREKAERYRLDANALMLQRDEAREKIERQADIGCSFQKTNPAMCGRYKQERDESQEKYATEATEHMLAVNKLCNERDEAREEINSIRITLSKNGEAVGNGEYDFSIIEMVENLMQSKHYFVRKSDSLERERDEAREKMADALQEVDLRMLDFERMKQERDKAMGALMKIEDLFIDGTDVYADRENMGLIAKAALEETK